MRRPYAWEGILLVFFFLLILLALNFVVGMLYAIFDTSMVFSPILILGELFFLVVVVVWVAVRRLPWQETFLLYKPDWRLMGLSVLIAMTWWPVAAGLASLFEQLFSLIGPPPEIPPPRNALDAIGYVAAIAILAPVCEEPVFRGFIMRGWLRYGFVAGIVGSGVLFGFQHAQLSGFIPLSLVGIVLGIIAFRSGSIWTVVTVHAVYNSLAVPFLIFEQLAETDEGIFMVAGLVALPIALLALWLFHRLASPFEPVERQSLIKNEGMAVLVTTLLMLGMFTVMIGLELLIRLYPDLGGV